MKKHRMNEQELIKLIPNFILNFTLSVEKEIPDGKPTTVEDLIFSIIKTTRQQILEEIYNSKKGDTIRVLKTDGKEQVWKLIKINKII